MDVMFTKDKKISCFITIWSAHKEEILNVQGCDLDLNFYVFIIESLKIMFEIGRGWSLTPLTIVTITAIPV